MGKTTLLDKNVVLLGIEENNAEDVLTKMSQQLIHNGYVKATYTQAIIDREETFSTGLPTGLRGIAIPHTSTEHVNEPVVSIGVLKNPVTFRMMGNHDEHISVDLVFMLALKEAHAQLEMLQNLMELIQDDQLLEKMRRAGSTEEVLELLNNRI